MEHQPKKLITRILEFAALLALAAFLIRLAVRFLMEVWWALLIIAAIVGGGIIVYRIYKNSVKW